MKRYIANSITDGKSLKIIKKPLLTEKSTNLNQFNQYSFVVSSESNSFEIRQAIEKIFKVKVIKVNTAIIRGKLKSFKGVNGYKKEVLVTHLRDRNIIYYTNENYAATNMVATLFCAEDESSVLYISIYLFLLVLAIFIKLF